MRSVPTALYLDFDNVFSGLLKLDPRLAVRFAETPSSWVDRLAAGMLNQGPRRWLILRCYMNPAGSVPHPDGNGSRLYFSKFRLPFTDAGFEVVDCPRLTHTKNGADIRLALDAAEALRADAQHEEFVIASGDSDMTPLLVRLRAADRQITVLSPSDSADVLGAIAHRLVGGAELLELLDDPPNGMAEDLFAPLAGEVEFERSDSTPDENLAALTLDSHDARSRFEQLVRASYDAAVAPLNIATWAHRLRNELGPITTSSEWFGHGGFTRALRAQQLPDARMSQHFIWDGRRHEAPDDTEGRAIPSDIPEAVARVTTELRLPWLAQHVWPVIYGSLAEFVAAYEFNHTEATRWARDRLVERGVEVNRKAVTIVAQGTSYGGCPLYRNPAPTAEEIGKAFVDNVVNRASAADIELTPHEVDEVRSWFGA